MQVVDIIGKKIVWAPISVLLLCLPIESAIICGAIGPCLNTFFIVFTAVVFIGIQF